jgi:hypothetical protein
MRFAHRKGESFHHIFPTEVQVGLCGSDPIVPVKISFDENGSHYGWEYPDGRISMIYENRTLLDMCFPDGIAGATKANRGRLVRLKVEDTE